jgi:hypothetical protein
MKTRNGIIGVIAIAALTSGCGIFHSSKSSKQLDQRDSTGKMEQHIATIDTGSVTVREVSNYSFLSPGFKTSSTTSIKPQDLLSRLTAGFTVLDTAMLSVALHYDSLKNALVVDAVKRPELGNARTEKTTTKKAGLTTISDTKAFTQVKSKKETVQKESKPDYSWILWVAGIIGGLGLLLLISHEFRPDGLFTKFFKKLS